MYLNLNENVLQLAFKYICANITVSALSIMQMQIKLNFISKLYLFTDNLVNYLYYMILVFMLHRLIIGPQCPCSGDYQ